MKQRFRKLTFVHVTDQMPPMKAHFTCGFDGIVDATYSQSYGGSNVRDYGVWEIRNGRVVNYHAWYDEGELTELPSQDRDRAEEMIEEYNLSRCSPIAYEP